VFSDRTPVPNNEEIYDHASAEEQDRYLELMRHDPIAGMAYLDALALMQQQQEGPSRPRPVDGDGGL
jgi:hypothetical protein